MHGPRGISAQATQTNQASISRRQALCCRQQTALPKQCSCKHCKRWHVAAPAPRHRSGGRRRLNTPLLLQTTTAAEGAYAHNNSARREECQTLETLLRDLLKNASSLPGKTYSPVTHPNFVKRNQSRETLQFGAYVDKNRVQNACVAPLPPPLLRVARRLKSSGSCLLHQMRVASIFTVKASGCPTISIRGSSSGLW